MSELEIRYQPTPNPNAGKFTLNRRIVEGRASRSFFTPAQAAADPVASALFQLDGVVSVFMVEDFVTVTKAPTAEWTALVPRITETLQRVIQ